MSQLKRKFKLAGEIGVSLLSTIPELFQLREVEINVAEERLAVLKALGGALKKLEQSREREGAHLRADMESQIDHLRKIAVQIEVRAAENGVRPQKSAEPQSERADRESGENSNVMFKGDINEEIVRLKTHVVALAKVVREREPVGKRIDFMLQEVNRELNTISSKVAHMPVTQLVLQGKERVEKIREQTQNVE